MNVFNSDVLDRVAVGIDMANAFGRRALPGIPSTRPTSIFEAHGYKPPTSDADWRAITSLAEQVGEVLHLIAAGNHRAAVDRVNRALSTQQVTPYLEPRPDGWALHFHAPGAGFADGWAGGIGAALAMSLSTAEAHRIGCCSAVGCTNLFLDNGRNRQRRFCSLQCQNRSKSARYRRQTHASTSAPRVTGVGSIDVPDRAARSPRRPGSPPG